MVLPGPLADTNTGEILELDPVTEDPNPESTDEIDPMIDVPGVVLTDEERAL